VPAERLERAGGSLTLRLEGGARALVVDLAGLFGLETAADTAAPVRLVVVAEGDRRLALRVDRFLGEQPLVQEAVDPFLGGLRGLTGTALLDDGRLAPIVNVVQVFAWAREDHARAARAAGATAAARPSGPARRTAIVAEDSELTRRLVADTLRRAGLDVVEAVDGLEALERASAAPPSLVVTDLEMPRMDGIELIRRLRAEPALARTPVVVFSTRDRPESKREAAEAGADAYLVKREFDDATLVATVTALLEREKGTPP
jgi:CheY-like chemotaxis protein